MVMTTDPTIQHTFPTQAAWRDVKLLVAGAGTWDSPEKFGSFRQEEPIDFFPTYYPALVPPSEPAAPSSGPQADPCGALSADEQTALIAEARDAKHAAEAAPSLDSLASSALTSDAQSLSSSTDSSGPRTARARKAQRSYEVKREGAARRPPSSPLVQRTQSWSSRTSPVLYS